jgi:RimJ/RimL family protein N-acetyltransferase
MVTIRAVRPDDRTRIVHAFNRLGPGTVYSRFFAFKASLTESDLDQIAETDFERDVMLVASIGHDDDETLIAAGSYSTCGRASDDWIAEVAFVVAEDYHRRGIATGLLTHVVAIASARGVTRFDADVLVENRAMLAVFARHGLPAQRSIDGGVVRLALELPLPAARPATTKA